MSYGSLFFNEQDAFVEEKPTDSKESIAAGKLSLLMEYLHALNGELTCFFVNLARCKAYGTILNEKYFFPSTFQRA